MKWNFGAYIIGPPEFGKSSVLVELFRRHMDTMPNPIAFMHDPVHQFAQEGCAYAADANAWRVQAAAAAKEKKPMPRAFSIGGSTSDLAELAMEVGERCGNTQWNVNTQIFVALDEQSENDSSGASHAGRVDTRMIAQRRHKGIGFAINMQDPMMMHPRLMRMATDFYLFRMTTTHSYAMDERLFLEKGTLHRAGVCSLPPRKYLHARQADGVVSEPL